VAKADELFAFVSKLEFQAGQQGIPANPEIRQIRTFLVEIANRAKTEPIDFLARQADEFLASFERIALHFATQAATESNNKSAALNDASREIRSFVSSSNITLSQFFETKIIDLTNWRRAKYADLIKEKCGADWFTISAADRRQRAHDMGAEIGKEFEDFEVTNAVFSKFIEPTLINPTFVTHLPKELVPLAKLTPDDPTTVEVFECCINGQEISPGYTEQNDPIQQRDTLEHQAGGEPQKLDEDFLVALEHGMPPAGGIGIGIDRLCMMLLGQESIRDVILFPQLKPK